MRAGTPHSPQRSRPARPAFVLSGPRPQARGRYPSCEAGVPFPRRL